MKISSIALNSLTEGLHAFNRVSLGDLVVVAGRNGSGKTRLLKLLEGYVKKLQDGIDDGTMSLRIPGDQSGEVSLTAENAGRIKLINYSHYDAQLQQPREFTPYVICKAKDLLGECNYEETALNSLLFLEDMAKGYSPEFSDGDAFENFVSEFATPFKLVVEKDEKNCLKLFGQKVEEERLSPGQRYLLRIAVACYQNRNDERMIFLLDEPELHLHPSAQIELIKALRSKFPKSQFWICTHSLTLISYLTVAEKDTTVLYMENGHTDLFRSNSSGMLEGLVGAEENRFAIRQLLGTPDEYACNKFAVECKNEPQVLEGATGKDPQAIMAGAVFRENDVVVDYGAGKGRLLEELSMGAYRDVLKSIKYYAYDPNDEVAGVCKRVMGSCGIHESHFFGDPSVMLGELKGRVDYVLLVNVLHEIDTIHWAKVFGIIFNLLNANGKLMIIEREELTIGEAPYHNGFLMLTENSANKLFSGGPFRPERNKKKNYIVKYTIPREAISVSDDAVYACVEQIHEDAIQCIDIIKNEKADSDIERYRSGIKLAFYLHQYANASLILRKKEKSYL